jgi:transposase
MDLRWRIIAACARGTESQREVAAFFEVSLATVENLLRLYRRTGDVAPQHHGRVGAPVRVDEQAREQLRQCLATQPDLTLAELQEKLVSRTGVVVSTSRLCRILQEMGLRRKKRPYMRRSGIPRAYVRLVGDTVAR